jgi:hypothetical protein
VLQLLAWGAVTSRFVLMPTSTRLARQRLREASQAVLAQRLGEDATIAGSISTEVRTGKR